MKVLHLVESFGGGVLTSVSQLCNLQVNQGDEVILVYSLRPETPGDFIKGLDSRVKTMTISMVRRVSFYRDLRSFFTVLGLLGQLKPDVFHLHSSKAGFIGRAAIFFGRYKDIRTFYSPRGFSFLQSNLSPLKRKLYFVLEKIGAFFGGIIVACSESEKKEAEKVTTRRITIIENAVDTKIIPLKKSQESNLDIKIGTLGRLCPQKNPGLFLNLAKAFLNDPRIHFIWIGGGEEDEFAGSSNIKITGWLPRQEALQELSKLDIYIQTSLWEGMPLSVIEALVMGLPAVVTNAVGNRDVVIHEETGYIAFNKVQMLQYIKRLSEDFKLRVKMGRKAREIGLKRFGLARLNQDMYTLYTKSLANDS